MAKKKLSEVLRDLFGAKLDEEIDLGDDDQVENNESTKEEKTEPEQTIEGEESKTKETSDEKEDENEKTDKAEDKEMADVKIFEDGWYDETSGKIILEKIKNPEALEAIKLLSNKYEAEKNQRLISDSISTEIKNYSLAVSEDTLRKVLDTSGVKIDTEGKVVGVREALETLKKSEPGFFKDKTKESNPLNEKFAPVEKQGTLTEDEVVALAYGQE